jgi:hypothetical protein
MDATVQIGQRTTIPSFLSGFAAVVDVSVALVGHNAAEVSIC